MHEAGRVIHVGGVDQQGNTVLASDAADLAHGKRFGAAFQMSGVHDHGGARGAGLLEFDGGCEGGSADLDESTSGDAYHAVIFIAVGFLDEDFAFETGSIGKLLPRVSVFCRRCRRRCRGDGGGGAGHDAGGLAPTRLSEDLA